MPSFTYEYTVGDTPNSVQNALLVQQKVDQGKVQHESLVKDLKRSFKLEGSVFDKTDSSEVNAAIQSFQKGADTHQKVLMNESQGLLTPVAELVGGSMLKPKCDLLLYEPLPNGKMPKPQKDQIYLQKDPTNPKKLQYIYLDPTKKEILGYSIDFDMGEAPLTQNKIDELKKTILARIDNESINMSVKTHYSDNITQLGIDITYNSFAKTQNESITLSGINVLYGYHNNDSNTFFYKPVGKPMQELSILINRDLFLDIQAEMKKFKDEFVNDGKVRPLIVTSNGQEIMIEPVLIVETNVTLKKGDPKPDTHMKITTNDPDSNILINNPEFNEQSKIHFKKIYFDQKQLDQMLDKAQQIQDSVQKWTDRLGSFLGKLIGGQDSLDQTMDAIKGALTDDFLMNLEDKTIFQKLYNLPLGDRVKAVTQAERVMLYPPPFPPPMAPTNPPSSAAPVKIEAPTVSAEPAADLSARRGSGAKP